MATALGNGDLQLMAEYDFKTPIDATVIIYDSEEENKPLAYKEQNSNDVTKSTDNYISDTFEDVCIAKNKSDHDTANTSTKRRIPSVSNNAKTIKLAENVTKDSTNELVFQNQEGVLTMNHTVNNIDYNKNIPREGQSANSNQITTTSQGSCERHPVVVTPPITFPQNEDDINKKANECLQTLLDTVSTHMIFIMQAYANYRVIRNRTSDRVVLEIARKHYLDTKSRLFYLSFSAVANILLPKENDKAFVENFVKNTIKIANSKHYYFTHSDMNFLCSEMFIWTKSHSRHPVISELLNRETQPNLLTTNSYKIQQDCNKATNALDSACVFRSGPSDREVTINVNSTVVQNRHNAKYQSHDPMLNEPSRQRALPPYSSVFARDELRNNSNSNYMQEFQNFSTSLHGNPNHKKKPERRRQTNKAQIKTPLYPAAPLQQTTRPPTYYSTQNWNYETVTQFPQVHSENQIINSAHNFQADQGQEDVNRSLSRDSGFMSPLSSVSNDQMCSSPGYNQHIDSSSTSVTPMITHVTSLNPSVAFIKDGICHVCGKLTKQKCLGCYKFYYCSHQCQIDDWKYHVFICK